MVWKQPFWSGFIERYPCPVHIVQTVTHPAKLTAVVIDFSFLSIQTEPIILKIRVVAAFPDMPDTA